MGKLTGKVAFITGASKGIGEGIAKVYAKYGAKVILAARSNRIEEIAENLRANGYEAIAVRMDVSNKGDIERAVECGIKAFGKIDILVNNAGVCKLGKFLEMSEEDRDFHIDVNIKGVWNTTKAILPYLIKNNYGKIVITSSVTGDMVADPGETAYAMTKAALVGFTKSLAVELAQYKINVNAICPGYVLTPMAEGIAKQSDEKSPDKVLKGIADAVPLKRLAEPEEIGELAAFLGSDESNYITGTQIVIDGGSTLPETISVGI
ncbi:SDR family oxidoreductase UcpA [Clostridium beijerinckii]|uniref:NAD(P)-dependent oxidoreductase n=1 Tax=Clostridium beijerinckii TaxID=1520 RepID=A0A1S9N5P8_CLOBE|nr:SDR family oxidoreductase UcpA [Clostridium beijerinckii]OOP72772.1 NAD(P)-dependent oxidoreductase [Clostridium beijerinckii]